MLLALLPFSFQMGLVLGLLLLAVILFAQEKLSVDVVTLSLLVVLVTAGILTPSQAFAGFSDDIIIILASIFVIGGALQETGVLDEIGGKLARLASGSENRLLLMLMSIVSAMSAFMNNTTVTAMFLNPTINVARRTGVPASKLLLPLAFASLLGGTCTLIGTSTNVAVSGYLKRLGMEPLGLFEITPIGLIIVAVGISYMMLIGKYFLPVRQGESLTEDYAMREYLTEIVVMPNSPLVGQPIMDSDLGVLKFTVLKIVRDGKTFAPRLGFRFAEGDVVLVKGLVSNLLKVKSIEGIEIQSDLKLGDKDMESENFHMAELILTPLSDLRGKTIVEARFRERYELTVLAMSRMGKSVREDLGAIRLEVGDTLLIQGDAERIARVRGNPSFAVLEEKELAQVQTGKGYLALGIFGAAIIAGTFQWMPLSIAFLAAALAMVLAKCVPIGRVYQYLDMKLLILVGGMTAFGTAMQVTGAAEFLASFVVDVFAPMGIYAVLGGFLLLTIALTQPMSNAAAALVVLPVALATAAKMGVNQRTFAIAIMLAASVSLITPFEPSCILVYGPGKYKFMDFLKNGLALTLILGVVIILLLPVFWPLEIVAGHSVTSPVAP
ncbi:MAG TPA: SLC13 family permease [Chthoniobacterales bacterium]|jgi:di/tricarboxylate transporter